MIKRIISVCIALCIVLCFSACTTGKKETDTSFDFVNDFANVQGYKNWYYFYGDTEEPKYMIFDVDYNMWRGRDFYSRVQINEQHPGNNTETIIAFKAPKDGKLKVDGSIVRCPAVWDGDGVFFYISYFYKVIAEEYMFSANIDTMDKTPTEYSFELEVKKDAFLYFTINANSSNTYDAVTNQILIKYI